MHFHIRFNSLYTEFYIHCVASNGIQSYQIGASTASLHVFSLTSSVSRYSNKISRAHNQAAFLCVLSEPCNVLLNHISGRCRQLQNSLMCEVSRQIPVLRLVITAPSDDLASNGARPLHQPVQCWLQIEILSSKYINLSYWATLCCPCVIFKMSHDTFMYF